MKAFSGLLAIALLTSAILGALLASPAGGILALSSPIESPLPQPIPSMTPTNACEQAMIEACKAGTETRWCTPEEIHAWCVPTGVLPTPTAEPVSWSAFAVTEQPTPAPVTFCPGVYVGLWMGLYPLYESEHGYCVLGWPAPR